MKKTILTSIILVLGSFAQVNPILTAYSVTAGPSPANSGTFTIVASSNQSETNIGNILFLVGNSSPSTVNACEIKFDYPSQVFSLIGDDGISIGANTGTAGQSKVLGNSQCAVNLSTATAVVRTSGQPGPTPQIATAVTIIFAAGFSGPKTLWEAVNPAPNTTITPTGWQNKGSWTVGTSSPPAVAVSPTTGTGTAGTFQITVTDQAGAGNITSIWFMVNATLAAPNACFISLDPRMPWLSLLNDTGDTWATPATFGAGSVQANSQCSVNPVSATRTVNGNQATIALPLTFTTAFAGAKSLLVYAANAQGLVSGWITAGNWTVPAGPAPSVTVSPTTGTGTAGTFQITVTDQAGAGNITSIWFMVNATLAAPNACFISLDPRMPWLSLLNDTGDTWATPATFGAGSVQANSQCSVNPVSATRTVNGNQATIALPLTFTTAFAGAKSLLVYAANAQGLVSGWITAGNWTIPTMLTIKDSTGSYQDIGSGDFGNDNFTGTSVALPSNAAPPPYLGLTTPSGNRLVHPGEPITITVSNAKPNSQVWIAETAATDPGVAQGAYTSSGYAGMTDNAGRFIWQTTVSAWLDSHAYTVWVGYWGGSATGPRPDTDIVGTLPIFAQNSAGSPAAPAGLADLTNQ